jgi:hypothetical protein
LTLLRDAVGVTAGLATLGCLAVGVRSLRRRFLRSLHGPPAWLADVVGVVTITVLASEVLGAVRLFRFAALVPALLACGVIAWCVGRRRPSPAGSAREENDARSEPAATPRTATGPIGTAVAIGAVGVLAAAWVPRLVHVYRTGPTTIDTLWYHLPIAARFAQTGSLLDIAFVSSGDSLPSFYPHSSELLHALGVAFLGHDTLTPVLNLFFLVVALLAAWCIGRPFGVAPLTFTAAAVVLGGPQLVTYEAGQGINDLFGVAMALAAIGPLLTTWSPTLRTAGLCFGGLAMGLALSSKFTVAGPALALTVCVVAFSPRGQRIRTATWWLGAMVLTGGFWYLRNLLAVGNPVPPVDVSIGPIDLPSLHVAGVSTIWRHLFEPERWSRDFFPGFRYALGQVWWAVLAVAVGGLVLGIITRVDVRIRLFAVVGVTSVVIYVFTPQLLGFADDAAFFKHNVRYLAIPLVLGAIALPAACARHGSRVTSVIAVLLAGVLLATQFDEKLWPFSGVAPPEFGLPRLSRPELALGIAAGAGVVFVIGASLIRRRARPALGTRRAIIVGGAAFASVFAVGLLALQHFYLERRYANAPALTGSYAWARDERDERIGVSGTIFQYPLTGNDISNHVEYLQRRASHLEPLAIDDCRMWRQAVNRARLDFVLVTTPRFSVGVPAPAREHAWIDNDPGAELVLTDGQSAAGAWIYRLRGRLDPSNCPTAGETAD